MPGLAAGLENILACSCTKHTGKKAAKALLTLTRKSKEDMLCNIN